MIDVGAKTPTLRRAVASGRIHMAPETVSRIRAGNMPKGDVLALSEVAGVMAAKRTSDILPLCHPLNVEHVGIRFHFLENAIHVTCDVSMTAKTGVEMEALTGVMAALLGIYDLTKGVDPVLSIGEVRLEVKEGGKSGRWIHPLHDETDAPVKSDRQVDHEEPNLAGVHAAVLTVSDRCSRGEASDVSGQQIIETLQKWKVEIHKTSVIPDEISRIREDVLRLVREANVDLVITTGGTGLGPRDVTPEALEPIYTKAIPGIGELLRTSGSAETTSAWLSRSGAGFIEKTLVVSLPGSPRAVQSGMNALAEVLSHVLHISRGGGH